MPYARRAGLWETFMAEGFDELAELTERAYPTLTGGGAQELLGAVFVMGHGLVPADGLPPAPGLDSAAGELLHAVAIKGSRPELPDGAESLLADGLLSRTRAGYMLTEEGREAHRGWLAEQREKLEQERLSVLYERFLAANGPFKEACARAGGAAGEELERIGEQIAAAVERIEPALRRTAESLPRFAAYQRRLTGALERARAGAPEYLTSTEVDSVHSVWMEIHEDYLLTLGRSREQEGSF